LHTYIPTAVFLLVIDLVSIVVNSGLINFLVAVSTQLLLNV